METRQSTHPSPRQLAALALGRLKPEARDRLQAHTSACASCAGVSLADPAGDAEVFAPAERGRRETRPSIRHRPPSGSTVTNPAWPCRRGPRAASPAEPSRQAPPPADSGADDSHSAGVAATDEVSHRAASRPRRHGLGLRGASRADGPPPGIEGHQPGTRRQPPGPVAFRARNSRRLPSSTIRTSPGPTTPRVSARCRRL